VFDIEDFSEKPNGDRTLGELLHLELRGAEQQAGNRLPPR
jgi:hypothetical protein